MNNDKLSQDNQLQGFCRGCLIRYPNPSDLIQYTEKNRRLFVYSTGLQVKRNDIFTFQLCKDCYVNMKLSCKFKKQCRTSDKKFKSFLRLKDISDIDLCTFLKNSDDMLRFTLLSGNSTPANPRNKDDDNESTCTSIQNFISDILQGTEMPDTEARIIKEVIEEEADVLEESLDSHWLQDDVSIDTNFRLDFSISPFSTRSVNNDHCYTPSKEFESGRNSNNHVKKVLEQLPIMREDFNISPKDISINGINEALKDICGKSQIGLEDDYMQDNLIEECVDANEEITMFQTDRDMPVLMDDTEYNFQAQNEIGIPVKDINMDFDSRLNKKNFYIPNDERTVIINEEELVINQKKSALNMPIPEQNTNECSIDRILNKALENNKKEIPLDDLLASPTEDFPEKPSMPNICEFSGMIGSSTPKFDNFAETIVRATITNEDFHEANKASTPKNHNIPKAVGISTPTVNDLPEGGGASTPMINNILFGEILELDDSTNQCKIGQCIEKFEGGKGEIDILEDFFNEGVKELDQKEQIKEHVNTVEPKMEVMNVDDSTSFNIEDYFCKICSKKYSSVQGLRVHMMKMHNINVAKFIHFDVKEKMCMHCGLMFKDRANFSRHVRSHDKEKYTCAHCKQEFCSESKLRQHSRVHKDPASEKVKKKEKNYICDVCGASFSNSSNYAKHARRHAAPGLACDLCGRRFHRTNDLMRHVRTHTNDRQHKCLLQGCDKTFLTRYNLLRHIKTHSDKKLFQCDYCSKEFRNKDYLIKHITTSVICINKRQKIIEKKPLKYTCFYCNKSFATKGRFTKHQEVVSECKKKREEAVGMDKSTIKVQLPDLYLKRPGETTDAATAIFSIKVLDNIETEQ